MTKDFLAMEHKLKGGISACMKRVQKRNAKGNAFFFNMKKRKMQRKENKA